MKNFRIGSGFDVHALEAGLDMWLGGLKIDHHSGFVAHSDGDVLIHALCDALLGAVAMGDIGLHFPDTSAEFKGADSKKLLAHCITLVREEGYELGNCDCTIMAQEPKLRPYIDSMRQVLADVMAVNVDQVSIKATTTEHLGFTGRKEGIAAQATVLIWK